VAAHALDELHGRPLATTLPAGELWSAAGLALTGAVVIGAALVVQAGWALLPFLLAGPLLVLAYNAELLGGAVHNAAGFAASWGAFPVLAAYVAQRGGLALAPLAAAAGAAALSLAQRRLSSAARLLRRRAGAVEGSVVLEDGSVLRLDRAALLAPLEASLRALSWGLVLLAAGLAVARLG